jgi:hypothetical protein
MKYKLIKNYHMENVVFGKDFNLRAISFFFHAFSPRGAIDGGCEGKFFWDETIKTLIPHIVKISVVE